jgi:hypothetical protein
VSEQSKPIVEVIGSLDIPEIDIEDIEGAVIVDAFVIFRYQAPEHPTPRMMYVGSSGQSEELRIGMVTSVLDRMRAVCTQNWTDE